MKDDRQPSIEAIFHGALDRGSSAERAAYLDGACGDDAEARTRVEALLAAHGEAGGFLSVPAVAPPSDGSAGVEAPGTRIGSYKLLQLIGEGGFGAVYMADQEEPVRRRVALKIIKLGMDTKQVIARFEAERQALALLDHPNIAKVLDAGSTKTGRPYFVMELVRGIALNKYCDKNSLPTRERLDLFIPICRAVQHAHQKGIIHRDLKPGNVLVTLHDGVPVPKVIDFGIARATNQRLTQKTLFTEYGQFIGTPEYMSPEQAEMSGLDIDTRTDIYSLGVILYELLTGTTPIQAKTFREAGLGRLQELIRENEPPIPSTRVSTMGDEIAEIARLRRLEPRALHRVLRGDLDWVVMKALEKDRTRRYATANELAEDVRRFRRREPVSAGPPRVVYKLRKFVVRHRVGVLAGSLVAAALLVGLGLAATGFVQARREANRSQKIADFLQDLLVSTDAERAVGQDVDVERVVATAREVFGDDHATVAATLRSRALQLQSTGNIAAAEPLYRESLRIRRKHHGEDMDVAVTLGCLGGLLVFKGDDLGAEQACRDALQITSRLPEAERAQACDTMDGLARLLMNRGEYDEAEELVRESLRLRRAHAPHQLLQIALSVNLLANTLIVAGEYEEATIAAEETLAAYRRALPPDSVFLAKVAGQFGKWLFEVGDLERAEQLLTEAMGIYRRASDPPLAERHYVQALLYHIVKSDSARTGELLEIGREFVAGTAEFLGDDGPRYGKLLYDFGSRIGRDHPTEALPHLLRAVEILTDCEGCERELNGAIEELRPIAWFVAREPGRTIEEYETALRAAETHLTHNPETFAVINTVGVAKYRLGHFEEALETLTRSDEHYSELYEGGVPPDVAFIAMANHRLGREPEARTALARLRKLMESPKNANDPEARAFLEEAEALLERKE